MDCPPVSGTRTLHDESRLAALLLQGVWGQFLHLVLNSLQLSLEHLTGPRRACDREALALDRQESLERVEIRCHAI